jgi:energy-coupling factor transporter ATP-binding protein EcfA2
MVVQKIEAASTAEKAAIAAGLNLTWDRTASLIGYSGGWVWQIGLMDEVGNLSYFLIQADGRPMPNQNAREVLNIAQDIGDGIVSRPLINTNFSSSEDTNAIKEKYLEYLCAEFGSITLEGMPADQEVHSRKFKLEHLYVPLSLSDLLPEPVIESELTETGQKGNLSVVKSGAVLTPTSDIATGDPEATAEYALNHSDDYQEDDDFYGTEKHHMPDKTGKLLGQILREHQRVAILGLPGSGKTTLLKRLAVAYADRSRLVASADELPDEDFFPVLVRCRSLGSPSRQPIIKMLLTQVDQAELVDEKNSFSKLLYSTLAAGRLLLLVDGLDEISSTSDRAAFVAQLRTFIGTYPTCRVVLTSREAGFRAVAGSVRSVCHPVRVENLNNNAIRTLVSDWHSKVIGTSAEVLEEANRLAGAIIDTDRLRRLAINPLLLTTLLLVKRWIGQLPRKRSLLYQKAVEVLLMTWNVEGHEPLDSEETMPQLGYAAFSMLRDGVTSVTADDLAKYFTESRRNLPELLGYARVSVHKLLERVEERSSLLTLSGHKLIDGEIKPTYEFKHLTFQEYFTALAIINGWLPMELQDLDPVQILGPRLNMESWQEVVALTTVLSGKRASDIVRALLAGRYPDENGNYQSFEKLQFKNLPLGHAPQPRDTNVLNCLADEAPIAPALAEEAILFCFTGRRWYSFNFGRGPVASIYGGRYQTLAQEIAYSGLQHESEAMSEFGQAFSSFGELDMESKFTSPEDKMEWIATCLRSSDRRENVLGAGVLMQTAYKQNSDNNYNDLIRHAIVLAATEFSNGGMDKVLAFMHIWAVVWGIEIVELSEELVNRVQLEAIRQWRTCNTYEFSRFCAWLITTLPLVGEWKIYGTEKEEIVAMAQRAFDHTARETEPDQGFFRNAGLVCHYYLTPVSGYPALVTLAQNVTNGRGLEFLEKFYTALGPSGYTALKELQERQAKSATQQRRRQIT